MVKVYRPDGVAEDKDPVDARECVEHCGYSYEEPFPGDSGDSGNADGMGDSDKTDDAGNSTAPVKGRKKNAKTTDSPTTAAADASSTTVADGEAASGAASNTDEAGG